MSYYHNIEEAVNDSLRIMFSLVDYSHTRKAKSSRGGKLGMPKYT